MIWAWLVSRLDILATPTPWSFLFTWFPRRSSTSTFIILTVLPFDSLKVVRRFSPGIAWEAFFGNFLSSSEDPTKIELYNSCRGFLIEFWMRTKIEQTWSRGVVYSVFTQVGDVW